MGGFPNRGKARAILAAIDAGNETVADIEVELDFKMSRHNIAGHVSVLINSGKVEKCGEVDMLVLASGTKRVFDVRRTRHRYRLTPQGRHHLTVSGVD